MDAARNQARTPQQAMELCAAVMRALTGAPDIGYRGSRLYRGHRLLPIDAPHLQSDPEIDDMASLRGAADGIALRLRHSDAGMHRRLRPEQAVERFIFNMLEQLRVDTLAPDSMPGMAHNLRHRFTAWSQAFYQSGLAETESGIVLYTLFQVCWSRVNRQPVMESTEGLIEASRAALAPVLGQHLAGLLRTREQQGAYAVHAAAIAATVGALIGAGDNAQQGVETIARSKRAFRLLQDVDGDGGDDILAPNSAGAAAPRAQHGYAIFTARYDREVDATKLVRKQLLHEYRTRLDLRIAASSINLGRLARQWLRLLAKPQVDGCSFGEEEGWIDGRRLAQLVSSPTERRLFYKEQHAPQSDALVSFLVDCSGSMKVHAETIACLIDVLVRTLEQAGASTEVLGFTTGAWNGGRALHDWRAAGAPADPGRLNELLHLRFKEAHSTWRRARPAIAALLKPDLYREGVDGEALAWACQRQRLWGDLQQRRILVVISDDRPMDGATSLANDDAYLSRHLTTVLDQIASQGDVEVCGLGVGTNLDPQVEPQLVSHYRRSLTLPATLDNELLAGIVQMIGRRH